jgi:CRP-like cAMP-binding protein
MKITLAEEIKFLRNVPLFSKMNPEELKILALTTDTVIYEDGEVIFTEGDEGNEACIIYSGSVEVYRRSTEGKLIPLNMLGPGEMFGELALFGTGVRTASVKAAEETTVAMISKEKLYQIIKEYPDVAIEMLKVQTQRFARAEARLMANIKDS